MPWPSSETWMSLRPPSFTATETLEAPASRLFSMSSFTADDGRWITSPAAMRFTTDSSNLRMRGGSPAHPPPRGEGSSMPRPARPLATAVRRRRRDGSDVVGTHSLERRRRRGDGKISRPPESPHYQSGGGGVSPAASPLLHGNRGGGDERDAAIPQLLLLLPLPLHLDGSACGASSGAGYMEKARLRAFQREQATAKTCMVSSFVTDFLEIRAKEPSVHVLLIPGNPGIVAFYKDFIEELYENLGGQASITERGRLFSLHEQIDHKVDFIEQEFQHSEQSLVLVGHSIGAYICLEIFKRLQKKVKLCVGLYPFLTLNKNSMKQSAIGYIARSSLLSKGVSSFVSFIGSLQASVTRGIVRRLLGPSWSVTAVEATCGHLLWYHTMRNVLFMAMTEFTKLSEEPDWNFISAKQDQIAFLFGVDDHWGPLAHLEEISKRAPGVALSVETEGHTHGYCCTEAGSFWAAGYVANLIKTKF
uniref:Lipid droplet-associated hydrolase n=1 Tax=Oryza meridionalis TaxID=40149 RepID=A0A0E0CD69_9ORYZ